MAGLHGRVEAATVVDDRDVQPSTSASQRHPNGGRFGVADHVGEGFLHDPVRDGLDRRGEPIGEREAVHQLDCEAGAGSEVRGESFESRDEADVVEHGRA